MALKPILPVMPDETLTSYMTRVAAFHAHTGLREFLSLIEVPQRALIDPKPSDLDLIAEIIGIPMERLLRMTFVSHGDRVRSVRGLEVSTEFTNYDQTKFCPACLLEDGGPDSLSGGHRVGRLAWRIVHVRSCRRHGTGLISRDHKHHSEKLQDMTILAPCDDALREMTNALPALPPSDLHVYLENRIDAEKGPEWLDGQPLDLAARACEMLGIILCKGSHCNLNLVTDAEWHEAGHLGFGFAARGDEGIREALAVMFDRFLETGRSGGPQMVLGRLYQWLQFNKNQRPKGPIREAVREFILDHFPIETGEILFGEPVQEQRVHTVATISRRSGQHPKTMNRVVVLSGLVRGDPEKSLGARSFCAKAAQALVDRIENSVSVVSLQSVLNCGRIQAEQLVQAGLLKRILDVDGKEGVLRNIPLDEIETFLSAVLAKAKHVERPSIGMVEPNRAAARLPWTFADIISAILSGDLKKVETENPELKLAGLRVDPEEIADVIKRSHGENLVGLKEAATMLGWPPALSSMIVGQKTPEGDDFIAKQTIKNVRGRCATLIRTEDLRAFRSAHVTLAEYAGYRGISSRILLSELRAKGISPLPIEKPTPVRIYRVADIRAAGLPL